MSDNGAQPKVPPRGINQQLLLSRWGGIGDLLWATPAIRLWHEQGYAVTVHTNERGRVALENNPYVHQVLVRDDSPTWGAQYGDWSKYFHKIVNLQDTIESKVCFHPHQRGYYSNHWMRQTDANFGDMTLAACGFPQAIGTLPEVYISDVETEFCDIFMKQHRDEGTLPVLWITSGSSANKHHPLAKQWVAEATRRFPNITIYVGGDAISKHFAPEPAERVKVVAGDWGLRRQMILAARAMAAVVGPESGLLVSAACGAVPKVVICSASAPVNITAYWINAYNVTNATPQTGCSPCYRIPHDPRDHPECAVWGDEIVAPDGKKGRQLLGFHCTLELDAEQIFTALGDVAAGCPSLACPVCEQRLCRRLAPGWGGCAGCGTVWRAEPPTAEVLEGHRSFMAQPLLRQKACYLAVTSLSLIERVTVGKGRTLDIGSATDDTAAMMRARGWKADQVSITAPIAVAEPYDCVWLGYALAEFRYPHEALKSAAQAVRPGGVLWLSIPNTGGPHLGMHLGAANATIPSFAVVERVMGECGFSLIRKFENTMPEIGFPLFGDTHALWKREDGAAASAPPVVEAEPLHFPPPAVGVLA